MPQQPKYLKNNDPDHLELHDLENEKPGCQISEIKDFEKLSISNLGQWFENNRDYDGCKYCLENYHKK